MSLWARIKQAASSVKSTITNVLFRGEKSPAISERPETPLDIKTTTQVTKKQAREYDPFREKISAPELEKKAEQINALVKEGKFAEAIQIIDDTKQNYKVSIGKSTNFDFAAARALLKSEKHDGTALKLFEKIALDRLDTKQQQILHTSVAMLLLRKSDKNANPEILTKAFSSIEKAIELGKERHLLNIDTMITAANIAYKLGKPSQALHYLKKIDQVTPVAGHEAKHREVETAIQTLRQKMGMVAKPVANTAGEKSSFNFAGASSSKISDEEAAATTDGIQSVAAAREDAAVTQACIVLGLNITSTTPTQAENIEEVAALSAIPEMDDEVGVKTGIMPLDTDSSDDEVPAELATDQNILPAPVRSAFNPARRSPLPNSAFNNTDLPDDDFLIAAAAKNAPDVQMVSASRPIVSQANPVSGSSKKTKEVADEGFLTSIAEAEATAEKPEPAGVA